MSVCPAKGTVTNTTSHAAAACSFEVPSTDPRGPSPRIPAALSAAAAPRSSEREPMITSSFARASLRARPKPSSPVPPMTAIAMRARAYPDLAATADVVDLLVQGRPGHGPAFVLQPLPQGLGPLTDGRPHAPEVLLGHLGEVAVGLGGGELVRGVLQHKHRGGEPVLDLVVHAPSLLSHRPGWYVPNTSRSASLTSPSVALDRSASFIGSSRLPVPCAVSVTRPMAASTAPWSRSARSLRTRSFWASTSDSSMVWISTA